MHRHTSIGRDSDPEDPASKFNFGLRSTRPTKKVQSNDANDSGSSGEEDDEDNFEILTAENLFSTLLSRVSLQKSIFFNKIKSHQAKKFSFQKFSGSCIDKSSKC